MCLVAFIDRSEEKEEEDVISELVTSSGFEECREIHTL